MQNAGPLPFSCHSHCHQGTTYRCPLSPPPNSPAQRPRVADDIDSNRCRTPSHHLEPAITAGQLLPRLRALLDHHVLSLTEASRCPVALADRYQGRYAAMMLVPCTR
jgi:hypothetical protein